MDKGKPTTTNPNIRGLWASLALRIVAPSMLGVLLMSAAIFGIILPYLETQLMKSKREVIHSLVQTVCAKLNAYERQVQLGTLDRQEAQEQAMSLVHDMHYGNQDKAYFWIMDADAHMLMHPYRPDLLGRDLSVEKDSYDNYIYQQLVEVAQKEGGGYVSYMFQWNDDSGKISPKVSYVQSFKPWGWVIGTGMYTEDVTAHIRTISHRLMGMVSVVLAIVTGLSGFVVWSSCRSEYRRRKAEAEVIQLNTSLEQRIEQRTLDLANANERLQVEVDERTEAQRALASTLQNQLEITDLQQNLLGTGDIADKMARITNTAVQMFQMAFCRIWLTADREFPPTDYSHGNMADASCTRQDDTPYLQLAASSGNYNSQDEHDQDRISFGNPGLGQFAAGTEHKLLTNNMIDNPPIHNHEWVRENGLVSFVAYQLRPPDGKTVGVLAASSKQPLTSEVNAALESLTNTATRVILSAKAEAAQRQLYNQLAQSQRLESVGQLAAGIAHEINTPTQFVSDNIRFLRGAFPKLQELLTQYRRIADACRSNTIDPVLLDDLAAVIKRTRLDYLLEQIPEAVSDSLEGLDRVTKIVRAMKDFSHPGQDAMALADLNKAVESTVMVARNEWKYVAEMKLDLDPGIPPIPCRTGDINQVILNLVVNAAHAIKDTGNGEQIKGLITITTRRCDDVVEMRISDTGTGIAPEYRQKIFDHFFTTKPVGRGTGQGLSFSRRVIVEQHGGSLTFETKMGEGTTFIIRLPIQGKSDTTPEVAQTDAPVNALA